MQFKKIMYILFGVLIVVLITGCGKDKFVPMCEKVNNYIGDYDAKKISVNELSNKLETEYNSYCIDSEINEALRYNKYDHCDYMKKVIKYVENGQTGEFMENNIVLLNSVCHRVIETNSSTDYLK